jgi:hypothetical protein
MKFLYPLIAACAIFVAGCVHLPSLGSTDGFPANSPGITRPVGPSASTATSPARRAIQTTFNWIATLSVVGGLACLALGGLSFYRGLILSGIKFVIAGILLPVSGIFVAYHWLLIVALVLIGLATYLLITYWSKVEPVLAKVESGVVAVADKAIPAGPSGPTGPAPAVATVAK